jgi:hypothetical protein
MKQVQYRRAAQSTGFRPVQISGNEIARMREESARVVQGMRDVRDAEIRQREAKLADEKEAQRLEARLRDKNRQIETANHQRTLTGLQQEARAKDQQFRQTQQDNAQILQSISTISESAGKAYTQYIEAEEDKTIAEELEKYIANPDEEILETLRNEGYLDVLDEMEQSKLDEYEARGGDPVVVAKGRNFSNRVRREILKGKAAYFYEYKYSQILDEAIQAEENRLGRPMDSAELAGYMTEVGGIVADRFRNQGGMTLKPGSMRAALESRERIHMARLTAKRSEEVKNQNQMTLDNATSILTTNPRDFEKNIIQSFQMVRRANGNDYAKAHDWYVSLATMQDANGKYLNVFCRQRSHKTTKVQMRCVTWITITRSDNFFKKIHRTNQFFKLSSLFDGCIVVTCLMCDVKCLTITMEAVACMNRSNTTKVRMFGYFKTKLLQGCTSVLISTFIAFISQGISKRSLKTVACKTCSKIRRSCNCLSNLLKRT